MTPRHQPDDDNKTTKDQLLGALQKGALLVAILTGAWAFAHEVGSTKLDVSTYMLDRMKDSLINVGTERERSKWETKIDKRTHALFCDKRPKDTECTNEQ
jgi:hypothetical protein